MIHEKLCVICEHWQFSGGEPGYSEMTPGSDATMGCAKGHWGRKFRLWDLYGTADFRAKIKIANNCADFSSPDKGGERLE